MYLNICVKEEPMNNNNYSKSYQLLNDDYYHYYVPFPNFPVFSKYFTSIIFIETT